jgi:uncharacterized membrane protein YgdD (TMEM256/DUF423 family)
VIRAWLAAAAVLGLSSVAAGAVGAHLAASGGAAGLLRTAALYGLSHAAVLVGLAALLRDREAPRLALIVAGWAFAVGTLLFSLSLIALGLTGIRAFGAVTPFGGAGLLIGWAAVAAYALRSPR